MLNTQIPCLMNTNIINVTKEKSMGFERGGGFFEYALNI